MIDHLFGPFPFKLGASFIWPFCIQTLSGEKRAFKLEDGWGILYNGRETDHWREPLESCYTRKRDKLKNWITRKEDDTYYHQISFHYGL